MSESRIAKNTLMLYFRMLFTVGVSFYSSRVVLNILGVEDYGIYNVVGGIVALFAFLNSTMSGATSRFIAYELGLGEKGRTNETFSASLMVHAVIALIIILLSETVGLWLLKQKLNIPEGREFISNIVYQISVLNCVILVMQVPYNASIIANEKMDVFAYLSILEAGGKLLILWLLKESSYDKLLSYSALLCGVSLVVTLLYRQYCVSRLSFCKFGLVRDKKVFMPLLKFSSWDLYGNLCATANAQGINIIINIFFGAVLNASIAIANQVNTGISLLAGNFLMAVRPQIVKRYAKDERESLLSLLYNTSSFAYLLTFVLAAPIIFETKTIVQLWLGSVPEHVIGFIRITIVASLIAILFSNVLIMAIHATGDIKQLSFVRGTIFLIPLPVSYLTLRFYPDEKLILYVNTLFVFLAGIYTVWLTKKMIPYFNIGMFIRKVLLNVIFVSVIVSIFCLLIVTYIPESIWRLLLTTVASIVIITNYSYWIICSEKMRTEIKEVIFRKLKIGV